MQPCQSNLKTPIRGIKFSSWVRVVHYHELYSMIYYVPDPHAVTTMVWNNCDNFDAHYSWGNNCKHDVFTIKARYDGALCIPGRCN